MYRTAVLSALLSASVVIGAVLAEESAPSPANENLVMVDHDSRGEIFADPNVDWSVYTQIMLDPATVAFRKNWQRDQNRNQPFNVRTKDMERIRSELSALFNEVFVEELTKKGGYNMVSEAGENVLRIDPAIIDLDVYAPDTRNNPGIQNYYTDSSGRMTLRLEMYDSVTGALIATARDRQESPRRGYMEWTTSVTNRRDARLILERWARELRERLDEARSRGKPSD